MYSSTFYIKYDVSLSISTLSKLLDVACICSTKICRSANCLLNDAIFYILYYMSRYEKYLASPSFLAGMFKKT